jgi:hypothetical protein
MLSQTLPSGKKVKEVVEEYLNNIIDMMPSDQLSYNMIQEVFNRDIDTYNENIDTQIIALESNNNLTKEEKEKLVLLKNSKLDVLLKSPDQFEEYKNKELEVNKELANLFDTLSLNLKDLSLLSSLQGGEVSLPDTNDYDELLNSNLVSYFITYNKDNTDLIESILNKTLPIDQFKLMLSDFFTELKGKEASYQEYRTLQNKGTATLNNLLETLSGPMSVKDYSTDLILKEIKNGNLDKELFYEIEKQYTNMVTILKNNYLNNTGFTDLQVIDVILKAQEYSDLMNDFNILLDEENTFEEAKEQLPNLPEFLIGSDKEQFYDNLSAINTILMDLDNDNILKFMELKKVVDKENKFISNSIYDFLGDFELTLDSENTDNRKSVMQILKEEELKLLSVSDISNYVAEGNRDLEILNAINTIKIFKSIINGSKTTELQGSLPNGFIMARQLFAKKNGIKDDVLNLKTVPSYAAEYMIKDLERIETKLEFLRQLGKNNASRNFVEQELLRKKVSTMMVEK